MVRPLELHAPKHVCRGDDEPNIGQVVRDKFNDTGVSGYGTFGNCLPPEAAKEDFLQDHSGPEHAERIRGDDRQSPRYPWIQQPNDGHSNRQPSRP